MSIAYKLNKLFNKLTTKTTKMQMQKYFQDTRYTVSCLEEVKKLFQKFCCNTLHTYTHTCCLIKYSEHVFAIIVTTKGFR